MISLDLQIGNLIGFLSIANLALLCLLLDNCEQQENELSSRHCWIGMSILNMILPLSVVSYVVFRIMKKLCCRKFIRDGPDMEELRRMSSDTDDAPEIPDRILHPERYSLENSYGSYEKSIV